MMADKCDCKVYPYTPGGIYQGYELVYCPRHAAADAMYDALLFAMSELREASLGGPAMLETAIFQAESALALADGDKGE